MCEEKYKAINIGPGDSRFRFEKGINGFTQVLVVEGENLLAQFYGQNAKLGARLFINALI